MEKLKGERELLGHSRCPYLVGKLHRREQALPIGVGREQEGCMGSRALRLALSLTTPHGAALDLEQEGRSLLWSPSSFLGEEVTVCRGGVSSLLCLH